MKFAFNKLSKEKCLGIVLVLLGFISFSGCNLQDKDPDYNYSELKLSEIDNQPLKKLTENEFSNYVKNGLRIRIRDNQVSLPLAAANDSGEYRSQFSTTNVHELGVDEADRIKQYQNYLFVVENPHFPHHSNSSLAGIRIMRTDSENVNAEQVGYIENNDQSLAIEGIYLHASEFQSNLVSLMATRFFSSDVFLADSDWSWNSGKTEVRLHAVDTPENPVLDWKLELEGNLQGSRKIGNKLYLITHFIPNISGLNMNAITAEDKISNENLIRNIPLSDLLPHYQINNAAIKTLVSHQECLASQGLDINHGYAEIITLTEVNLDSKSIDSSICLNANVEGIYSSSKNLYIGVSGQINNPDSQVWTNVHKFSYQQNGIIYAGTGMVTGRLGWSDPSFKMNEYQDMLRIVTTDTVDNQLFHRLFILQDRGHQQLVEIAKLPNETEITPIGKVGEDIFAVRFIEEKAYVVTFQRQDPLYQINLHNPEHPYIASALEIPGFARYLHPIAENWVLGVGHQIDDNAIGGIKIELYDLRDVNEPKIANSVIVGESGSWSESLEDLLSISILQLDPQRLQVALPINRYTKQSNEFSKWQDSGLYLFQIDEFSTNNLKLELTGTLITESTSANSSYPVSWGSGRSKINSEAIFYLQGNQLWGASQMSTDLLLGPF